jgi:hypothetical protein
MTTTTPMNFAPDHGCKTDWLLDGGLRASPSPRRSSVGRGGVFLPALGEHRTFNIEHPTSNALPKGRPLDVRCWEFEVGCFPLSLGGPRVVPTRSAPLDRAIQNHPHRTRPVHPLRTGTVRGPNLPDREPSRARSAPPDRTTQARFQNGSGGAGRAATCPSPSGASGDGIMRAPICSQSPLRPHQCGRHSSQHDEFYPTGFGPAALPNVLNHSTCIAP